MKLPIPATSEIKRISQTTATSVDSFTTLLKNVTVEIVEGNPRATRRLGAEVVHDASGVPISPSYGRGIFCPPQSTSIYFFVNNNTCYRSSYASSMGTLGTGVGFLENSKVFFTGVDDGTYDAVVADPVNSSAAGTLNALTTGGTLTNVATLPGGIDGAAAWLNGRVFIP